MISTADVDELIIFGEKYNVITQFQNHTARLIRVNALEKLTWFLGIEMELQHSKTVMLRQSDLVGQLLRTRETMEAQLMLRSKYPAKQLSEEQGLHVNAPDTFYRIEESVIYLATKRRRDATVAASTLGIHMAHAKKYSQQSASCIPL